MTGVFGRLTKAARRRLGDLRLPQWRYRTPGVSLRVVAKNLRHMIDRPDADVLDAYQLSLSTVLDVLEENDLGYFMVEGAWGSPPVVGLTSTTAKRFIQELKRHGAHQPVYVVYKRPRRPRRIRLARSIASRHMDFLLEKGFTVVSFLHNLTTGRKLGADYGCVIDIWSEEPDATLRNHKPRTERADIIPGSSRRLVEGTTYGFPTVTYPPLHGGGLFDIDFPVDVVYLWVDGSDRAWQERKAQRFVELGHASASEAQIEARFRQFDELRYSLRSLERYAPWVRNVYLVTDRQRPQWLDESGTNLRVVDHTEILPASALPTFNSHAITASLHHIPGLSEHFLLMNDDVLFGRPVPAERFFQSNGVAKFFLSRSLLASEPQAAHEWARLHSCDLIESITGFRPTHVMKHTPMALNRKLLTDLEEEYAPVWKATVHNPFRTPKDVVPEYLHHYIGYAHKMTVPARIDYRYFAFGPDSGMAGLQRYQRSDQAEVLCVNDLGGEPDQIDTHHAMLTGFFQNQFPTPSSYEQSP